jgi:two-component system, sensor histidine kinase and response regulator
LSTAPAAPGDRRLALGVILLSLLIFISLAPFARVPLPPVFGFLPIYETAIAFSDLVTVAILLIQFNILRSRTLLALACGYLFTALMAISHALTFPGSRPRCAPTATG